MNMTNGSGYACPFLDAGCGRRCKTFDELKVHVGDHPRSVKIYQEILGMFWGPILWHYFTARSWPVLGKIFSNRVPGVLQRIQRMNTEEAISYWKEGTEEMGDIIRINEEEEEEEEEARSEARREGSMPPILLL
jgi:hypothetical protein